MDKIVGKIALVSLMMSASLSAQMTLRVTNMRGQEIKQAVVGEPFMVHVASDDTGNEPEIKGLRDFFVKRTGYRITTVNGVSSAQHSYQVRIDRPGTYTIGPAQGANERSNAVRLPVTVSNGRPTASGHQSRQHAQQEAKNDQVLLRFKADKEHAYVGEQIEVTLRFIAPASERITVEQLITDVPESVHMQQKQEPTKQLYEVENESFVIYEWQFVMYPKQAGRIVLPAYHLDYTKELDNGVSFGTFASLFGPRLERRRVYSNALTFDIRPLPKSDEPVQAVGHFTHFQATIEPAVAKQYEGVVLSLAVEGAGDLEQLPAPTLERMPVGLKWYSSKRSLEDAPTGKRKTFEYIVQGLEAGEHHIPSQTFRYFDVQQGTYKTLSTAPLLLTITDMPGQASPTQPAIALPTVDKTPQKVPTDEQSVAPLMQHVGQQSCASAPLPLWLFLLLFGIPLWYWCYQWLLRHRAALLQRFVPHYAKRQAFALAQKALARAYQQKDVQALHRLFASLFAARLGITQAQVTMVRMQSVGAESALSDQEKKQWQQFVQELTQAAYGGVSSKERLRLFHEAAHWLQEVQRMM